MATARGLCILVVEENEDSLAALARLLEFNGHTVYRAHTAAGARDLAEAQRCDLFIADIGAGDRSALDLMRELRERYGIKGIAFSASAAKQHVRDALAAGFEVHLVKPLAYTELLAAIERLTRKRTTSERVDSRGA